MTEHADILEKAADLLFVHGRCTGHGIKPDGRMCVRGAINVAVGGDASMVMGAFDGYKTADLVDAYLAAHPDLIPAYKREAHSDWIDEGRFPCWVWNDGLTDAADDELVIDTLRMCAKDARNE